MSAPAAASESEAPTPASADTATAPTVLSSFEPAPTSWPSVSALGEWLSARPHRLLPGTYEGTLAVPSTRGTGATPLHRAKAVLTVTKVEPLPHGAGEMLPVSSTLEEAQATRERLMAVLSGTAARPLRVEATLEWTAPGVRRTQVSLIGSCSFDGRLDLRVPTSVLDQFVATVKWKPMLAGGQGRFVIAGRFGLDESALALELNTVPLVEIKTVSGCPIASQPVTNLALVCRFLTAPELLAAYQTNTLLSAAASHPLTFQHGVEVGLHSSLNKCHSYALGPSATFTESTKLEAAFESRLFRHFRIVHLRLDSSHDIAACLDALVQPNAPKLRALTIDGSIRFGSRPEALRTAPSLAYLSMVHLTFPVVDLAVLVPHLPPSVDLLHLSFKSSMVLPPMLVDYLVGPDCAITRLIFDQAKEHEESVITTTQTCMEGLARLQATPRIEQLHWRLPICLSPKLEALPPIGLTSVRLRTLMLGFEDTTTPSLQMFPNVERLTIDNLEVKKQPKGKKSKQQQPPQSIVYSEWPATLRSGLRELSLHVDADDDVEQNIVNHAIAMLTGAGLSQLRTLAIKSGRTTSSRLPELWSSMPLLTDLTISCFDTFEPFHLLPNLTTLRGIGWPQKVEHTDSLAKSFPALTSMQVEFAADNSVITWKNLLQTIPNLRLIKWRKQPWMHPNEIEARCAVLEAERQQAHAQQAAKDQAERDERVRVAQAKGVAAAASIDAIAPPEDELRNWFQNVNMSAVAENAEDISTRLRQQTKPVETPFTMDKPLSTFNFGTASTPLPSFTTDSAANALLSFGSSSFAGASSGFSFAPTAAPATPVKGAASSVDAPAIASPFSFSATGAPAPFAVATPIEFASPTSFSVEGAFASPSAGAAGVPLTSSGFKAKATTSSSKRGTPKR